MRFMGTMMEGEGGFAGNRETEREEEPRNDRGGGPRANRIPDYRNGNSQSLSLTVPREFREVYADARTGTSRGAARARVARGFRIMVRARSPLVIVPRARATVASRVAHNRGETARACTFAVSRRSRSQSPGQNCGAEVGGGGNRGAGKRSKEMRRKRMKKRGRLWLRGGANRIPVDFRILANELATNPYKRARV